MRHVSIPHRYDPNNAGTAGRNPGAALFQFLIGTIQTEKYFHIGIRFEEFQFLIGTIQTSEADFGRLVTC